MKRRWLISDIDGTLTGSDTALARLSGHLERRSAPRFGVASGRSPELVEQAVRDFGLPEPELVIASVGSEIAGAGRSWSDWPPAPARAGFRRDEILSVLRGVSGVEPQGAEGQGPYKLSFTATAAAAAAARQELRAAGLTVSVIHSAGRWLDVLPEGVTKGTAVRFFSRATGVPLSDIVVAGDTGNDLDLLLSGARAVLVANHTEELAHLRGDPRVYAAAKPHAAGVLEGLEHHFGAAEAGEGQGPA